VNFGALWWVFGGLTALAAFAFGLCVFSLRKHARLLARANSWPVAAGRVLKTQMHSYYVSRVGMRYWPLVDYAYRVDGRDYTSRMIGLGAPLIFGSERRAQEILARYPAGAAVQVRYDPADPGQAALELRAPVLTTVKVLIVVSGVLFLFTLALPFLVLPGVFGPRSVL
jgi:hypothetical protein